MSVVSDPFDARRAAAATGVLREFNDAAVLSGADVHVALRLAALVAEDREAVRLAAALAVRGPRLGHVFVDLRTVRDTVAVDADEPVDVSSLPWPDAAEWIAAVAVSPLVGDGAPLRLDGTRLYLDRYWREELRVADDLLKLTEHGRLSVIAGGPGTGKTTEVAGIVATMVTDAAARGERPPLIALAAPTGKAAARLEEVVGQQVPLRASTLHRLLGWRPGSHSRFAHDRGNRLPHDVVVVDETSMVSLSLMARLLEAVRADARLILVGDPAQLASIEAGVVLGDIVGPSSGERGIVVLDRVHRFGPGIARVAEAIRRGDGDGTLAALTAAPDEVTWLPLDAEGHEVELVRERAVAAGCAMTDAARRGAAREALAALGGFRLLCAHRRGPHGVADWTARVGSWLAEQVDQLDLDQRDYPGRPLLVTENDYELGLYNGDAGMIVSTSDGRLEAVFERGGELLRFSPLRLGAAETVYAMTIHKSQGSQFDTAAVVLPAAGSRILTRELLYTAVTRARQELILVGTEETVRSAVARPVARASGLRERLWPN